MTLCISETIDEGGLFDREVSQIPIVAERAIEAPIDIEYPTKSRLFILGRGSSGCAGAAIARLLMKKKGQICTPLAPSSATLRLPFENSAVLIISQSGESPDLINAAHSIRQHGGTVISVTNSKINPLAIASDSNLNIYAGHERAVAASKTVVNTIVRIARWAGMSYRYRFLEKRNIQSSESLTSFLVEQPFVIIIGRGFGLGIASEMALKIQELLGKPAMAFSSAEVMHGPITMLHRSGGLIALAGGEFTHSVRNTVISANLPSDRAEILASPKWFGSELLLLQGFYFHLAEACRRLNLPVDTPVGLSKITKTS